MRSGYTEMADSLQNNSPNKTRIECHRSSVITILKCVEDNSRRYLSDVFTEKEFEFYVAKFVEAYKKILLTNTSIDGQNVKDFQDMGTSSECEPFDSAKEHYIEHELMDTFCQQVVTTTQLRKTAPKKANRKMKCLIRPELKYATLVSVELDGLDGEAMETNEESNKKNLSLTDITLRFHQATEKTYNLKPTCDSLLEKARSLSQAYEIYQQSENNEMVKAMYETPPNTPDTASDKPFINTERTISKKLLLL